MGQLVHSRADGLFGLACLPRTSPQCIDNSYTAAQNP